MAMFNGYAKSPEGTHNQDVHHREYEKIKFGKKRHGRRLNTETYMVNLRYGDVSLLALPYYRKLFFFRDRVLDWRSQA